MKDEAELTHRSLTSVALTALEDHAAQLRRRRRLGTVMQQMEALRNAIESRSGRTQDSALLLREDRQR
ncbi:MAG: hypothetical protein HY319_24885 [Armatimonadetes bacterium]|nr:hypothetical protein [Armatimonadota bacterium]